jgi:hypothetical protein
MCNVYKAIVKLFVTVKNNSIEAAQVSALNLVGVQLGLFDNKLPVVEKTGALNEHAVVNLTVYAEGETKQEAEKVLKDNLSDKFQMLYTPKGEPLFDLIMDSEPLKDETPPSVFKPMSKNKPDVKHEIPTPVTSADVANDDEDDEDEDMIRAAESVKRSLRDMFQSIFVVNKKE